MFTKLLATSAGPHADARMTVCLDSEKFCVYPINVGEKPYSEPLAESWTLPGLPSIAIDHSSSWHACGKKV